MVVEAKWTRENSIVEFPRLSDTRYSVNANAKFNNFYGMSIDNGE